jgi:hypothetical protein
MSRVSRSGCFLFTMPSFLNFYLTSLLINNAWCDLRSGELLNMNKNILSTNLLTIEHVDPLLDNDGEVNYNSG